MKPAFLGYDEARATLGWTEAVGALRAGHMLPRAELHDLLTGPTDALLLTRTAHIEGMGYGVKVESVFSGNAAAGLPNTHGAVLVYAPDNGILRGIIDSQAVTDIKTAADSVLGASLLARPDSRHLLIVGAGHVAANLAHAYCAAFPQLDTITIWARRTEQAYRLAGQLGTLPVSVTVSHDLPSALADADIVSSATQAREPLLPGRWVRPGTHIDLVGAFTADMREADDALIAAGSLYVDSKETTRHIGDVAGPIASGAVGADHVRGDLYDLLANAGPPIKSPAQTTIFKNGGGGHLDLMVAHAMLAKQSSRDQV
ncbi:ornithine cyclodeaminase family protein [Massilia sp.]|uniref:ornithine cyclodeaminase family protein n=1 Tax=Massilia sp. TaxID=1882437 RepID=UPI00352C4DDF